MLSIDALRGSSAAAAAADGARRPRGRRQSRGDARAADAADASSCSPVPATTAATASSSRALLRERGFTTSTSCSAAIVAQLPADAAAAYRALQRGRRRDCCATPPHGVAGADRRRAVRHRLLAAAIDVAVCAARRMGQRERRADPGARHSHRASTPTPASRIAPAIRATATATFIALKPGLLTCDGPDRCGERRAHARTSTTRSGRAPAGRCLEWAALARALPASPRASRAATCTRARSARSRVVGGAEGHGRRAAARRPRRAATGRRQGRGSGFAADDPPLVDWGSPELMLRDAGAVCDGVTTLVVGPGPRHGERRPRAASRARSRYERTARARRRRAQPASPAIPRLRDGDRAARTAPTLVTPHPAEAARLLGVRHAGDPGAIASPPRRCSRRELRAHVVLKGAGSIARAIPTARGTSTRAAIPALATRRLGRRARRHARRAARAAHRRAKRHAHRACACTARRPTALVARGDRTAGPDGVGVVDDARELVNAARAMRGKALTDSERAANRNLTFPRSEPAMRTLRAAHLRQPAASSRASVVPRLAARDAPSRRVLQRERLARVRT